MGTLWTIGHSNHPIGEFLSLLGTQSIESIADVRRFPGSRRHPQFGADLLREALSTAGIGYHHLAGLGADEENRRPTRLTQVGEWPRSMRMPITWTPSRSCRTSTP